MSTPALPLLTSNPLGWAVLGVAGYIAYKSGKKAGAKAAGQQNADPLHDRVVKGAMKSAYKAKKSVDDSLNSTKEKYSAMWNEAQDEVSGA